MAQIRWLIVLLMFCSVTLANAFEEKIVVTDGIKIYTEALGQPQSKPLLLIAGAGMPGVMWSDEFCQRFVDQGYFIIRYDYRDVGKSDFVDYQKQPYTLADLAKDAVAILDAYGLEKAHVIGMSMGGFVGQLMALDHSDRILSLVSLMSSPDHRVLMAAIKGEETRQFSLPPPAKELLMAWAEMKNNPSRTREEKIAKDLKNLRLCSGTEGFDEQEMRQLAEKIIECTKDSGARFNHWQALFASSSRIERLSAVRVPTLVIHGGSDVLLPPAHGVATAQAIPNAKLVVIPAMGHVLCKHFYDQLILLIIEHHGSI